MKTTFTLSLLGLAFAGSPAAFAQGADITNNGATIALTNGAILYTTGAVTNAAGGTLNLGTGTQSQLHVGGNFTNAGTIVPGNGAVVLIGATAQTLNLNGTAPTGAGATPVTLHDLLVNTTGGAAVNVTSDVAVGNLLSFGASSGRVITTPTATVTLPAEATVGGAGETNAHYVVGNLRSERAAVNGSAPVNFGNGAVLNPSGNSLGNVAVVRSAGLQTDNLSQGVNAANATIRGIDQVWRIIPATQPAAAAPVNVQLTWLSANDNGLTNFNAARMWRRESASASWLAVGPYADASSRTLAGDVLGPLYQVTVSTLAAPLPVELLSFAAERRGEAARLVWRTASEKNNNFFGLEVSTDGRTFREFARVAGQGNATTPRSYEAFDPALLRYQAEVVYYRLRQVDTDGTATFSPVATVQVPTTGFAATAAPNPLAADGTRVRIATGTAGPAELVVYDGVGRLLLGRRTELLVGTNEVNLSDAGKLATGVYFLKVSQGTRHAVLKLVRE